MIICMNWSTSHEFGSALPDYHRLRYQLYIAQESWSVPHFDNMEYDEFDTPATVYLICQQTDGKVLGGTRLIPTTRPYMMEKLWPGLVGDRPIPKSPGIWEGSRLMTAPGLDRGIRRLALAETVTAVQQFCLDYGIEQMFFEMPPRLFHSWQEREPGVYGVLGPTLTLEDGAELLCGSMRISREVFEEQKARVGIVSNPIRYPKEGLPYQRVA